MFVWSAISEFNRLVRWSFVRLDDTSRLHKALQDQHRGHAVNGLGPFLEADLIFPQKTVGLSRGKSLIP